METKEKTTVETQGVETKKREKTISLTSKQIGEIIETPIIGIELINQIDQSEGNLKGNIAFAIAKAITRQTKLITEKIKQ